MKVIAAKGTICPMEDNPRSYITESSPQDVPESTYYLRLIDDGSLIRVGDEPQTKTKGGKS